MSERRSKLGAGLVLLALFVLATVLVARPGSRVHSLQNDEVIAQNGGAWLSRHFPWGLVDWQHLSGRGFERLAEYVTSFGHAVAPDAASAFPIQHWLMAAVWATSAIWTYLLAREIGVERLGALAAAAATVLATWRILGTSFLNSSPAYATLPLAAWLVLRAVVRPSAMGDALALAGLLLVALSRTGNLLVTLIMPVAMIVAALLSPAPGEGRLRALRRLPRRHPLIALAVAGATVVVVAVGAQDIVSGYRVHGTTWHNLWDRLQIVTAQLGEGLFIVPVAVAGGWVLTGLVRERPVHVRVFAWIVLVAFLALLYASALAGAEERYVAPLVPLFVVAFVAALQRREVGLVSALVGVALVARAIAVQPPVFDQGPYAFFASAGQQSFTRLILQRGSVDLPIGRHHVLLVVTLTCLAFIAILAVMSRGRLGREAAVVAVAIPLAWGAVAGAYVTKKFVDGAGLATVTWDQRTFVDQVAGDRFVGALDYDPTFAGAMVPFWHEITAFNRQVQETVAYGFKATLVCCGFDIRNGRLWGNLDTGRVYTNGRIPQLLVWLQRYAPWGLDADIVGGESYLPRPAQILRLNGPPRLAYSVRGASKIGEVLNARPVRIRVFAPSRPAQRCLIVRLAASEGYVGKPPRRYELRWPGGSRRGNLTTAYDTLTLPLPAIAPGNHADVRLAVRSSEHLGAAPIANLAATDRVTCPPNTP